MDVAVKYPIRLKLLLLTLIPLAALIIVSGYSYFQISQSNDHIHTIAELEEGLVKQLNADDQAIHSASHQDKLRQLIFDTKYYALNVEKMEESTLINVSLLSLFAILFSLLLNFYISKYINRSINQAVTFADRISEGERNIATQHISTDETGRLMHMLHKMQNNILETETALKEKEHQVRLITDSIPAMICYLDSTLIFRFCNLAYAKLLYRSKQEIIGETITNILGEELYKDIEHYVHSALKGHDVTYEKEITIHKKTVYLSVHYVPDVNDEGHIDGFITVLNDISAMKQSQLELENQKMALEIQTETDPLTGLYNRRSFTKFIDKQIERFENSETPFAIMMIDLDHFKTINDTYGHSSGDKVLKIVANLLQDNFRDSDFVCRYGGEEFSVVLSNTTPDNAKLLAERIRVLIEKAHIPLTKDIRIDFTCSIGLSSYDASQKSADDFIHAADSALYRAKEEGRNRIVITN